MIDKHIIHAYKVLDGEELSNSEILTLCKIEGEDIMDLASLANKVRVKFSKSINACSIVNAKSALCGEDCKYCAQSTHYKTGAVKYPLLNETEIIKEASLAYSQGIRKFGIVTSGRGYTKINSEFKQVLQNIDAVQSAFPDMEVCASLGILSDEVACELAKHNIAEYNHNIEVNPEKYSELVSSTHSIDERISTLKSMKKYGVSICCGGIIGLGETMEDRALMAIALKELQPSTIPINILMPIQGTPVYDEIGETHENISDIIKSVALFRLVHPNTTIKLAAGRETIMKDFQGTLLLSGANGFITGGYLTTRGREVSEDNSLINAIENF